MIKFIINVLEIAVILRVSYKTVRFLFWRKKGNKHKKSIIGKVWLLASRNIHHALDQKIKAQKESLAGTQQSDDKVVSIAQFRKSKA